MPTHVATRQGFPLTEWARHALPGPLFGFAIAGGITLPHVPIAEGRSGQHIDSALLRHVLFTSPAPLGDLRSFIFGDHALKLRQKPILRRGADWGVQEDYLHSTTRQFFHS